MLDQYEFSRWMRSAKKTLESAKGDLERGDYNWACFKSQQAAELSVKALLHGLGLPAYGHSISRLLADMKSKGIPISDELMENAKTLDKYYIPTRYPNAWAEGSPYEYYTINDAIRGIECAKNIISWVEETWKYLKKEEN